MTKPADPKTTGVITGIAMRPTKGAPLSEVEECRVLVNTGIEGENRPPGRRSVTFLSAEAWAKTCAEVGADLAWPLRRANFLVEGIELPPLIGRAILVGQVRVWIHDETKPCRLMDEQHDGLRAALKPDCRGGVFGQVLTEGTIRVGDRVQPAPPLEAGQASHTDRD